MDISDQEGVGAWEATTEPIAPSTHPEGEVMVGRAVRVPLATYERIQVLADARGTSPSRLIRQWIDEGLQRADIGDERPDPVAELHRTIDAANRALMALRFDDIRAKIPAAQRLSEDEALRTAGEEKTATRVERDQAQTD